MPWCRFRNQLSMVLFLPSPSSFFCFLVCSVIGCPMDLKVGVPRCPDVPPHFAPNLLGAQRYKGGWGAFIRTAVRISPVWVREFTNSRSRKAFP